MVNTTAAAVGDDNLQGEGGPYDYLDIFDAPNETTAAKVVMIIRSYGHGQTETWTAMPWERFEIMLPK